MDQTRNELAVEIPGSINLFRSNVSCRDISAFGRSGGVCVAQLLFGDISRLCLRRSKCAKSFGFAKSASLPGHQWSGAGTQYRFYHIRSVHLGCVDRWPPSILDRLLFVASA